jgi:hypothetical protein
MFLGSLPDMARIDLVRHVTDFHVAVPLTGLAAAFEKAEGIHRRA